MRSSCVFANQTSHAGIVIFKEISFSPGSGSPPVSIALSPAESCETVATMFPLYLDGPLIMTINITLNQLLCWFGLVHFVFR